jgi:hypothetical protein
VFSIGVDDEVADKKFCFFVFIILYITTHMINNKMHIHIIVRHKIKALFIIKSNKSLTDCVSSFVLFDSAVEY